MSYIDGFVIAVPTANKQKFIDHAKLGDSVFIDLGAMRVIECWGDDVPDGKVTDFRKAVQAEDGRNGRLLVDRVAGQGNARRRHGKDDRLDEQPGKGRPAHGSREKPDALRRQAPDLWRLRAGGRPRRQLSQNGDMTMPGTVNLHRVFAAKPDKVYRAFLEADAVASWLPPFGFVCTVHELDAKEGGRHRMSFRNFTTGNSHSFGGTYLKLVPGKKLRLH